MMTKIASTSWLPFGPERPQVHARGAAQHMHNSTAASWWEEVADMHHNSTAEVQRHLFAGITALQHDHNMLPTRFTLQNDQLISRWSSPMVVAQN